MISSHIPSTHNQIIASKLCCRFLPPSMSQYWIYAPTHSFDSRNSGWAYGRRMTYRMEVHSESDFPRNLTHKIPYVRVFWIPLFLSCHLGNFERWFKEYRRHYTYVIQSSSLNFKLSILNQMRLCIDNLEIKAMLQKSYFYSTRNFKAPIKCQELWLTQRNQRRMGHLCYENICLYPNFNQLVSPYRAPTICL